MTRSARLADHHRAVIVGGCGFLGSNLAFSLARDGASVTVVDVRPAPPELKALCAFERHDVTAGHSLRGVLADADTVVVMAAKLAKQCDEDPADAWRTNVDGTARTLSAIVESGARPRVVFFSSGSVYATPAARYPTPEDSHTSDASIYARSKLTGERLTEEAASAGSFSAVVLRPPTVYGPGPAAGERGHFIAGWIDRAVRGEPLPVHDAGTQTVDLVHVYDVVLACRLALDLALPSAACRVFNVGSGRESRVLDVARWMHDVEPSLEFVHVAGQGTPDRQLLDLTRARDELGFVPRTPPDAGVKHLLRQRLGRAP